MTERNYPKEIKKRISEVKRKNGFTQESADELTSLINDKAWLWALLYFPKPLKAPLDDIISVELLDISDEYQEYATLEYTTPKGKFIPIYTSEHYPNNLKNVVKLENFPFVYLQKVTVESMLQKAQKSNIAGIIINPHIEGVTLSL